MKINAQLLSERIKTAELTLSVSKAKTFADCAAKFKFCYIDKLPRIDRDFHIFGKFMHAILESFHKALIVDPSLKDNWQDVLNDTAWDTAYEEYSEQLTGTQYKDAKAMVKEYQELLEKTGLPEVTGVEDPFYILLGNRVLLNGFIDRIQLDPDGVWHVVDYKTTKDPKYLKDVFQLLTYCYFLMLKDPSIERIRGSFILLKHKFRYLTHDFSRDEVFKVAEKFMKYAEQIEEEKLWRPNPQFLCKYCDYVESCPEGKDFLIKRKLIDVPKTIPFVGIRKW